jgi:hypothetical protein
MRRRLLLSDEGELRGGSPESGAGTAIRRSGDGDDDDCLSSGKERR